MTIRSKKEEKEALLGIRKEAERYFLNSVPSHDFNHVKRVVMYARKISPEKYLFLTEAAAWLHDIGRIMEKKGVGKCGIDHAFESAKIASKILDKYGFEKKEKMAITGAIARHNKLNAEDDTKIAILLKDADRLDGIGAIGIIRAIMDKHDMRIYIGRKDLQGCKTDEKSIQTVYGGIKRHSEFYRMLRIKKAKKMAKRGNEFISYFKKLLDQEIRDI